MILETHSWFYFVIPTKITGLFLWVLLHCLHLSKYFVHLLFHSFHFLTNIQWEKKKFHSHCHASYVLQLKLVLHFYWVRAMKMTCITKENSRNANSSSYSFLFSVRVDAWYFNKSTFCLQNFIRITILITVLL